MVFENCQREWSEMAGKSKWVVVPFAIGGVLGALLGPHYSYFSGSLNGGGDHFQNPFLTPYPYLAIGVLEGISGLMSAVAHRVAMTPWISGLYALLCGAVLWIGVAIAVEMIEACSRRGADMASVLKHVMHPGEYYSAPIPIKKHEGH